MFMSMLRMVAFLSLLMPLAIAVGDAPVEKVLPGSAIAIEDATAKAAVIATATLTHLRVGDPTAPGRAEYAADISVIKALKGKDVPEKLSFNLRVETHAGEVAPEEKTQYIFFFKSLPRREVAFIKMMADTEENVATVTKLLKAAETQKGADTQEAP